MSHVVFYEMRCEIIFYQNTNDIKSYSFSLNRQHFQKIHYQIYTNRKKNQPVYNIRKDEILRRKTCPKVKISKCLRPVSVISGTSSCVTSCTFQAEREIWLGRLSS